MYYDPALDIFALRDFRLENEVDPEIRASG